MKALVLGGAASGKSFYAESLACTLSPVRSYIATMQNQGSEAQMRIAKHRQNRAWAGFETLEVIGTLAGIVPAAERAAGVALLDDVGNLVSNALFSPAGEMADADSVLAQLDGELAALCAQYAHVVVVGNMVGAEGARFTDATKVWVELVGALCARLAARCDYVVEVVAGIPSVLKGEKLDIISFPDNAARREAAQGSLGYAPEEEGC